MKSPRAPEVDVMAGFDEYFDELDDPRMESKTHHPLLSVLMITVLGVLCGAESWVDLAIFAQAKRTFLSDFLDLPHGPPRKDTFRRVFEALEPMAFRRCFLRWIGELVGSLEGKHVAIDGKTLRAALAHRDVLPLHLVHAWVVDNQVLFAQLAGWGKGQELSALPDLLRLLNVRGATITIDALGCQREIAQQIREQKADYLLNVKDNQPTLHQEVRRHLLAVREAAARDAPPATEAAPALRRRNGEVRRTAPTAPAPALPLHTRTEEHGHGRREVREVWVSHDLTSCPEARGWPGVASLVLIERTRTIGDVTESAAHCYISSTPRLDAVTALTLARNHWSVENGLHWTLDVAFREDQSRIHDPNGAQNFALVRRIGLNALKRDRKLKHGVRAKQKNCGWDHDYLLSILQLMKPQGKETTLEIV
jgi:predicted transposase YbfD/YdcC